MSSLSISFARNTVIQTIGKIVSITLGWFMVLTMTNYLGATGFGAYTIMTTYLQFFAVAIDLGFVLVSSQMLAEYADRQEQVFANLFTFRLCTSVGILVLAPILIWLFPYTMAVKQGVVVLTISFALIALLQVFTGLFQKELAIGRAIIGELAGRTILFIIVVMAAWQGRSLLFIINGVVLGSIANFLLALALSRRFVRLRLAYDPTLWHMIWQRSWPLAAGIVFNLIYLKADTLIMSLTRSAAEVGVYGAMYRILEVLITFPTMFAGLLLPLISLAWSRNDYPEFKKLSQQALDVVIYMAWPLVVGAAFVSSRLVALFGEDFHGAEMILWLLVFATAIIFVGTTFGHIVVAMGKQRSMIFAYASAAGLGLLGYIIFIPRYGAYAAAGMTIVVEMLVAIAAYIVVRRILNFSFSFTKLGLALIASLPMSLFLWSTSSWSLVIVIFGAVFIYVVMLYLMGAISSEFIRDMIRFSSHSLDETTAAPNPPG